MQVLRATSAGFCFGVSLALKKLEKALIEHQKEPICNGVAIKRITTLGPIIHNPPLVREYADRGVVCLEDYSEAQKNDVVVIRAHGVSKEYEKAIADKGCRIIDATCPKVKKAQLSIEQGCSASDQHLILFGEAHHPEVLGLLSYVGNSYQVFDSLEDLKNFTPEKNISYVLAAQTTQAQEEYTRLRFSFEKKLNENACRELVVLETICDATCERQNELNNIAGQVEVMIIVGGKNSGNTRRLAELSEKAGVYTIHIENPDDLPLQKISAYAKAGLTAGASTPEKDIDRVEEILKSL